MDKCECIRDGWCPRYSREVGPGMRVICAEDSERGAAYRQLWLTEKLPAPPWEKGSATKRIWPLFARIISMLRTDEDRGIGDTVARNLSKFGANALKRVFKRLTGRECGCADRQAALNHLYPYERLLR
jgi:hypothetical protein